MDALPLKHPDLYLNRELSQLEFNRRVLAQALDPEVPLLERLRFLCITSTNLDEFFETRVARLKERIASGIVHSGGPEQSSPSELLSQIGAIMRELLDQQYQTLNEVLIPALAQERIRFIRRTEWTGAQEAWIRYYFEHHLLPVLSPFALDPAHPFPRILNKSLNFIVSLTGTDAFGRTGSVAVVQTPRSLPRLIQLPPEYAGPHDFVFLSSVVHTQVSELFPGMEITGCYQFRVTRNSELFVDAEEIDDLLRAIEGELASRRYGDAVRLEISDNCPAHLANYLLQRFDLAHQDLYQVNGPVNLGRLLLVCDMVDRPDLKYPPFTPALPRYTKHHDDVFAAIRASDILLHHPYESFMPVVDFLRQAAADPQVLAIKQTLYRTGANSVLVEALVNAARAGKAVTVVVELRARYDEEANINLASLLQEAGAHVVYGVVGYKTHAKMILVVRREDAALRNYVHLGTGNYHERTARAYTDLGLFTCDPALGEDVHKLFLELTSLGHVPTLHKLLQAPFTLHTALLGKIERETAHGANGRIIAKLNALVDPPIIQALYQASQAGVQIDLIVRGICCLRPGVPGVSETIRVRSIIGRFLEHTRVYYFHNGGDAEVWLASADWMDRNFFHRVEVAFPIENSDLRLRVIAEGLDPFLADNTQAWALHDDGRYRRINPDGATPRTAQLELLRALGEGV